jgi:hypothetical protein
LQHVGAAAGHAHDEARIQGLGLGLQGALLHLDARAVQQVQTLVGDQRIRVHHGRHHAAHAGLHEGLGAGRGAALVGTGLEGYVDRGALGPLARPA